MAPDLLLWNSIPTRLRSPSDGFEENGLAILETYLRQRGFNVRVEDWATPHFHGRLGSNVLAQLNAAISLPLLRRLSSGKNINWFERLSVGGLSYSVQWLVDRLRRQALRRHLDALAADIAAQRIAVLGIKVWYGDAFRWACYLVDQVRRRSPQTITVGGGPQATIYEEDLLRYSNFDLAVYSEGEETLATLLNVCRASPDRRTALAHMRQLAEAGAVQNLLYRTDDEGAAAEVRKTSRSEVVIDDKVVPEYSPSEEKVKVHVIIDSLGCPWDKCNFCVHTKFYGRYRKKTPALVVDEIAAMREAGFGLFRFAGSSTALPHAVGIATEILARDLRLEFSMFSIPVRGAPRPSNYARVVEQFRVLVRAGLRAVFMGGETGNDLLNDVVMNKGTTADDVVASITAIREAARLEGTPIDVGLAIIYPTPTLGLVSLEQVFADTMRLIERSRPDSVITSPAAPFKNTPWYERREEFGFSFDDSIVPQMMEYEYVLYKPRSLWPRINISLDAKPALDVFAENERLRRAVHALDIATEVTDEHFVLLRAAGYRGREGIRTFKFDALQSIYSTDYDFLCRLYATVNAYSNDLARSSTAVLA